MPSGSRGSVSTTSGAPHGQRCATPRTPRGSRPSWRGRPRRGRPREQRIRRAALTARRVPGVGGAGTLSHSARVPGPLGRARAAPETAAEDSGAFGSRRARGTRSRPASRSTAARGPAAATYAGSFQRSRSACSAATRSRSSATPARRAAISARWARYCADRDEQRDGHGDQDQREDRGAAGERGPARHRARPRAGRGGAAHRPRAGAPPPRGRPAPARIAGGPAARAGSAARRGGRHGDECA